MGKNVRCVVILLLAFVFMAASHTAAQSRRVAPTPIPTPEETEKVYTEEVKLNVLAFDENGNFFPDVTEQDLVITENNILHQPGTVRRIPANVLIVMDTGGEMRAVKSLDQTRKAATALVRALKEGDSVALMDYSDRAEVRLGWTSDRGQIMKAIRSTNFGRRSALVDAIRKAKEFLSNNSRENKHLVLITDGTDSSVNPETKNLALRSLLATDVTVHVISYTKMEAADIQPRTKAISNSPPPKAMPDEVRAQLPNGVRDIANAPIRKTINLDRTLIRKLKARQADLQASEKTLEQVAENSNGEFILPDSTDEMLEKAPLVARMIDSSYVVTYVPKVPVRETRGSHERNIEVTSKRNGLIVQARRKLVVENE